MTPLVRWLRDVRDRYLGRFYEGPEPPERLGQIVLAFAAAHPRATRAEWMAFAEAHAQEAYRSGYVRGYEWTQRDLHARPDVPPEVIADEADPDWRWRRAIPIEGDLVEVVPEEWPAGVLEERDMEKVNRG